MDSVAVELVNAQQAGRVHDALRLLQRESVVRWETLWLCYVGDPALPAAKRKALTHEEAAQRLGCSRQAVGQRLWWVEVWLDDWLRQSI